MMAKEICIISGKGGTGKTSLSAAFATLSKKMIVADCDVDAANLYLILQPDNNINQSFISGYKAVLNTSLCNQCNLCAGYCRFEAISISGKGITISEIFCDGCKLCSRVCPHGAIRMIPNDQSKWYSGNYRNGRMVHARLAPGEENSGKLVNIVREYARKVSEQTGWNTIIIDGPPGTGCPVISSLTGTSTAIIVTEPSMSGLHDLKRIAELTRNFKIQTYVVINKYDINPAIVTEISKWCRENNLEVIGNIPFDQSITEAMIHCKSINEWKPDSAAAIEIIKIWDRIQ